MWMEQKKPGTCSFIGGVWRLYGLCRLWEHVKRQSSKDCRGMILKSFMLLRYLHMPELFPDDASVSSIPCRITPGDNCEKDHPRHSGSCVQNSNLYTYSSLDVLPVPELFLDFAAVTTTAWITLGNHRPIVQNCGKCMLN